jgi:hypothetical protein
VSARRRHGLAVRRGALRRGAARIAARAPVLPMPGPLRRMPADQRAQLGLFMGGSAALIAVPLLVVWALLRADGTDISAHGWAAIVLGAVGSAALAIGLMSAVFASDRSGQDARAAGRMRDEV